MPSSSFSSIPFNIFMDRKKRRSSSSTTDDLATVKAAAWAWYQHNSGSEGKPMREFDVTRTHHHHQTFKPSRYKLEAMEKIKEGSAQETSSPSPPSPPSSSHKPSPVRTEDNSLLDTYEIERISKQLDHLLASSSNRFYSKLFDRDLDRQNSSKSTISSSSDIGYSTSATTISRSPMKKNKKFLKGLLMRHTIVCGTREDVDSRALRPVPVPGRHVPVVRGNL